MMPKEEAYPCLGAPHCKLGHVLCIPSVMCEYPAKRVRGKQKSHPASILLFASQNDPETNNIFVS